jgi:hypothetical protein
MPLSFVLIPDEAGSNGPKRKASHATIISTEAQSGTIAVTQEHRFESGDIGYIWVTSSGTSRVFRCQVSLGILALLVSSVGQNSGWWFKNDKD